MRDRWLRYFSVVVSLAAFGGFVLVALDLVFAKGVCCADDANNAVTAKSLADGLGYVTTISQLPDKFGVSAFNVNVTTGPTLVLPAALFIAIFGNTYWAPGLSLVVCWSVVLVVLWLLLRSCNAGLGLALFTLTFLYLSYSIMSFHFEQWYALLGEIPAALLLILGILLFLRGGSRRSRVLAGLLLGLAVLAKLSAFIGVVAFGLVAAILDWLERKRSAPLVSPEFASDVAQMALGFAIPVVLFEAWKLVVLGPAGYSSNAVAAWEYMTTQAASSHQAPTLLGLYSDGVAALLARFNLLLPDLALGFVIVWLLIRNEPWLRRLYVILVGIVVAYSAWWIFFSIGWPRYYVLAILVIVFLLALPFLRASGSWRLSLSYLLLLGLWSSSSWNRLGFPFSGLDGRLFWPSSQTQALVKASDFLAPIAARNGIIVTEWWATGVDMEYMLPTHHNFIHWKDAEAMRRDPYWIAVNTKFLDGKDPAFASLLAMCGEAQTMDVYIVEKCNPAAASPGP